MPITDNAIRRYRLGLKDRLSTDLIQRLRRKSAEGKYGSDVARKVFEGIEDESALSNTMFSPLEPASFPKLEDISFPVPGVVTKQVTIEASFGKPSGSTARAVMAAMSGMKPERTPDEIARDAIASSGAQPSRVETKMFGGAPIEPVIPSPIVGMPPIPLPPSRSVEKSREPSQAISQLVAPPAAPGPFPDRGPRVQPLAAIAQPGAPTWQDIYADNKRRVAQLFGVDAGPTERFAQPFGAQSPEPAAVLRPVKDPLRDRVDTIAMAVLGRPIRGQDEYDAVMEYLRQSGAFDVFNRDVSDDIIAKAIRAGAAVNSYRNAAKSFLSLGLLGE